MRKCYLIIMKVSGTLLLFFQALNFPVENFGLLNELFPLPSILEAGYPVFFFFFQMSCVTGISDSKVIICMGNSGSNTEQAPFR
jgi:hypothetical protein